MPAQCKILIHSLLNFKNFISATVFNIKSPNFRHLQIFTCSLHFWNLQSASIRFLIDSRSATEKGLFQPVILSPNYEPLGNNVPQNLKTTSDTHHFTVIYFKDKLPFVARHKSQTCHYTCKQSTPGGVRISPRLFSRGWSWEQVLSQ